MKEIVIAISKNKPKDLNWQEYSLLCIIPELSFNELKEDLIALNILETKGYIRIFEEEIVITEKYSKMSEKTTEITEIIKFFNTIMQLPKGISTTAKANRSIISARLSEGHSKEDIINVITHQFNEWKGDYKMRKYLRLETILAAGHFSSYFANYQLSLTTEGLNRM